MKRDLSNLGFVLLLLFRPHGTILRNTSKCVCDVDMHRNGNEVFFTTHICVTRPRRVKSICIMPIICVNKYCTLNLNALFFCTFCQLHRFLFHNHMGYNRADYICISHTFFCITSISQNTV